MGSKLPPDSVIATWPAPNYIDPVTHGPGLLIANCILCSISLILIAARLYTRVFITSTIGLDDLFAVIGFILTVGMCVTTSLASSRYGWNVHIWDLKFSDYSSTLKCQMAFELLFCGGSTFTKLSLLWFCRRIIGKGKKGSFRIFNYFLVGTMVLLVLLGVLFICITLFGCSPIKVAFTMVPDYPYHCVDQNASLIFASSFNVFTDFLTNVVPMPLIWKLKMHRRQRLAVIGIFGLGITVSIASSVRTYYAWLSSYGSWDRTWYGWDNAMAASVELNLGLVCACAPALRPLIKAIAPHIMSSNKASEYSKKPKTWPSSGGLLSPLSPKALFTSEVQEIKSVGSIHRPASRPQNSILCTVELDTFYQDRKDFANMNNSSRLPNSEYNPPSGRGRPGLASQKTNNHDRFDYAKDSVQTSYYMDRDSSRGSRSQKNVYREEDEEPFALEKA